ncbi:hypothetical protein C2E15_12075 [Mixta gaviniae]|uniref:Uncharacterized protein n=1 Tax=Mixta gaviniae TaxID=665914 RepID=A0A2L0IGT5_9GAMM|nr:hypothetical protein C2E15_12075 [Mixta gaviniae]
MNPHDRLSVVYPPVRQFWRAFPCLLHLHENYYMKRAGVAGIALRAEGENMCVVGCVSPRRRAQWFEVAER